MKSVENYEIEGNNTKIYCSDSVGMAMFNVSNLKISNVAIIGCGKMYNTNFSNENNGIPPYWSGALYLYYCSSVKLSNISVIVTAGVTGIISINISRKQCSEFMQVTVIANCDHISSVNGMIFYYYDYSYKTVEKGEHVNKIIQYIFKTNNLCLCTSSLALNIVMIQKMYSVSTKVHNSNFCYLHNSSVLHYRSESCGNNTIVFQNCNSTYNTGNSTMNLFHFIVYMQGSALNDNGENHCNHQESIISFRKCNFNNNSDFNSMIYILLKTPYH